MAELTLESLNARLTRQGEEIKKMKETQGEQGVKLEAVHDAIVGTTKEKGMRDMVDRLVEAHDEGKGFKRAATLLVLGALVGFIFTALGAAIGFTPGRAKAAELMAPALALVSAPAQAQGIGPSETEAPEPDPGQAWPPDPALARAVWVRPAGVAFHVTVGRFPQTFPQYHRCVTGDARRVVTMGPDTTPLAHVAGANSGTVGIALCCAVGSTYGPGPRFDLVGGLQPLPRQVEDAAALAAEVVAKWGLDPNGMRTLANGARVPVLGTHRDYALAGGYGAWRLDPGGNVAAQLRTKVRWYFAQIKAGKRQPVWVR